MIPFEQENQRAYILLLRIEIALRELLKISLESQFGVSWQKKLPGELLTKIKKSQTEENKPQFDFIRLGPLYYLTFGELLTLLQQKSGRQVAENLGGDCFLKQLENLFSPRNALCHARPVSSVGLKTIETLYAQLETALKAERMARLLAKPDIGLSQQAAAEALIPSLQLVLNDVPNLPSIFSVPETFQTAASQFWWADESLAGFNCAAVDAAMTLIREYNSLPKGVGSAATRQRFCEQREIVKRLQEAITELKKAKS
jgi:hypothetical protein